MENPKHRKSPVASEPALGNKVHDQNSILAAGKQVATSVQAQMNPGHQCFQALEVRQHLQPKGWA